MYRKRLAEEDEFESTASRYFEMLSGFFEQLHDVDDNELDHADRKDVVLSFDPGLKHFGFAGFERVVPDATVDCCFPLLRMSPLRLISWALFSLNLRSRQTRSSVVDAVLSVMEFLDNHLNLMNAKSIHVIVEQQVMGNSKCLTVNTVIDCYFKMKYGTRPRLPNLTISNVTAKQKMAWSENKKMSYKNRKNFSVQLCLEMFNLPKTETERHLHHFLTEQLSVKKDDVCDPIVQALSFFSPINPSLPQNETISIPSSVKQPNNYMGDQNRKNNDDSTDNNDETRVNTTNQTIISFDKNDFMKPENKYKSIKPRNAIF